MIGPLVHHPLAEHFSYPSGNARVLLSGLYSCPSGYFFIHGDGNVLHSTILVQHEVCVKRSKREKRLRPGKLGTQPGFASNSDFGNQHQQALAPKSGCVPNLLVAFCAGRLDEPGYHRGRGSFSSLYLGSPAIGHASPMPETPGASLPIRRNWTEHGTTPLPRRAPDEVRQTGIPDRTNHIQRIYPDDIQACHPWPDQKYVQKTGNA